MTKQERIHKQQEGLRQVNKYAWMAVIPLIIGSIYALLTNQNWYVVGFILLVGIMTTLSYKKYQVRLTLTNSSEVKRLTTYQFVLSITYIFVLFSLASALAFIENHFVLIAIGLVLLSLLEALASKILVKKITKLDPDMPTDSEVTRGVAKGV